MDQHESEHTEAGAKPSDAEEKKRLSPQESITRWPVYTHALIEQFFGPTRVSFHCSNPTCGKETTWARFRRFRKRQVGKISGFKWVWYLCGLCSLR
jgi:hypothetical protein